MSKTNYNTITKQFADHKEDPTSTDWQLGYRNVIEILEPLKGKTVLDFGCGPGGFGRTLTKLGAKVVAVDKSPEMVRLAQTTNPSAKTLIYQPGKFGRQIIQVVDVATVNFVLCAVFDGEEVLKILKDIASVLRPGGRLVILEPNQEESNGREFRSFTYLPKDKKQAGDSVQVAFKGDDQMLLTDVYRPKAVLTSLLKQAGFGVVAVSEPLAPKDWDPEWQAEKQHPPFVIYEAVIPKSRRK